MSSFKTLNKTDITVVPYIANKQWNFSYNNQYPENEIVYYEAKKEAFNILGDTTTNNQYQSLLFDSINHLFYQSYNGDLLDTGSLMFNVNTYESASQQRPTASYFDYNINPKLIKNLPTASGDSIKILNISQKIFGSKILPYSFNITSSNIYIQDDGNGNLYDVSGSNPEVNIAHIGNIFYSHGIIVLTNQSSYYNDMFTGSYNISFQNEHIIYENEIRCIVKESEYNLSYNSSLQSDNSGSLYGFATSSSFYPYATSIGLYNEDNELLMVAKMAKPIMMSPNTDMTFIIKYDI